MDQELIPLFLPKTITSYLSLYHTLSPLLLIPAFYLIRFKSLLSMESSQYQTAPQFQDLNACSYDDNGEPLESLDLFLQLFNEPSPSSQFLDLEGDFSAE